MFQTTNQYIKSPAVLAQPQTTAKLDETDESLQRKPLASWHGPEM